FLLHLSSASPPLPSLSFIASFPFFFLFFLTIPRPPSSTLFPYTTLFRSLTGLDRLRPFGKVEVSIGHPIWPDPPASWRMARRIERIVDRVRRAIQRALGRVGEGGPTWRSRLRSFPRRLRARLRHPLRRSQVS